jgi:hypothetical protein
MLVECTRSHTTHRKSTPLAEEYNRPTDVNDIKDTEWFTGYTLYHPLLIYLVIPFIYIS